MGSYLRRIGNRWSYWTRDPFFTFRWWKDLPAAICFALFG